MFCVQHKYYFLKYQKVVCALWTDPLFLVNESMEEALAFLLSSYLTPPSFSPREAVQKYTERRKTKQEGSKCCNNSWRVGDLELKGTQD
jgi:hypothetical protein